MEKIWFIQIDNKTEGPYSFLDLRRDPRITPETLVWKEGFKTWKPIGKVKELKKIFEDDEPTDEADEPKTKKLKTKSLPSKNEIVLSYQEDFPPFLFWILIGILLLSYMVYRFSGL